MTTRDVFLVVALGFLGATTLPAANDVAAAEAAARSFLIAVYQNDHDLAAARVVDARGLADFIGDETLDSSVRKRVRAEIETLDIGLAPGYEDLAEPGRDESLPPGATIRFSSTYRGTPMVVTTVRTTEGWKVDLRWWEAMIRVSRGERLSKRHPEVLARRFLLALMQRNEKALARLIPKGYSPERLYPAGFEPPFEDQYFYLAIEMPLVELDAGDLVRGPDGSLTPALKSDSTDKYLVGLYWDTELHFRLIADGESFRVTPGDHLARIGL